MVTSKELKDGQTVYFNSEDGWTFATVKKQPHEATVVVLETGEEFKVKDCGDLIATSLFEVASRIDIDEDEDYESNVYLEDEDDEDGEEDEGFDDECDDECPNMKSIPFSDIEIIVDGSYEDYDELSDFFDDLSKKKDKGTLVVNVFDTSANTVFSHKVVDGKIKDVEVFNLPGNRGVKDENDEEYVKSRCEDEQCSCGCDDCDCGCECDDEDDSDEEECNNRYSCKIEVPSYSIRLKRMETTANLVRAYEDFQKKIVEFLEAEI